MDVYAKSLFRGAHYEESNVIQHFSNNSICIITAKHILRDSNIHFIRRATTMAERIFRKQTIFGDSEIFIDDRTKMIANPAFRQKITLIETGCEKMADYIEELKLKGYEEVTR